jgi:hypothetical protein
MNGLRADLMSALSPNQLNRRPAIRRRAPRSAEDRQELKLCRASIAEFNLSASLPRLGVRPCCYPFAAARDPRLDGPELGSPKTGRLGCPNLSHVVGN